MKQEEKTSIYEERKTLDDYYALPEDERVELIDGKFYAMSAPTVWHQAWALELTVAFREYVKNHKGKCKVFVAPCDVHLDRDEHTMVQPDVMICCKREQITKNRIEGAPDFILEIVSPGSQYVDFHLKLRKYKEAGVREYWIVNPLIERVTVYHFEKTKQGKEYTFEEQIPVGIYAGDCVIDFAKLRETVRMQFE